MEARLLSPSLVCSCHMIVESLLGDGDWQVSKLARKMARKTGTKKKHKIKEKQRAGVHQELETNQFNLLPQR